jgi:endonuclease YncB( thermonuclease family)
MSRGHRRLLPAALLAALLCVLALAGGGLASELRGKVVKVRDGDSVDVLFGKRVFKLRLFGVDCPERGQPFSAQAKKLTADLAGNRDVTVRVVDRDRYGRIVGDVVLPGGRHLAHELLRAGLAWHYARYANDAELARLEADARAVRRGIWSEPHPVPPWRYRGARRKR